MTWYFMMFSSLCSDVPSWVTRFLKHICSKSNLLLCNHGKGRQCSLSFVNIMFLMFPKVNIIDYCNSQDVGVSATCFGLKHNTFEALIWDTSSKFKKCFSEVVLNKNEADTKKIKKMAASSMFSAPTGVFMLREKFHHDDVPIVPYYRCMK